MGRNYHVGQFPCEGRHHHVGQEREEAQRATTLSPYCRFFAAFSATFRSHSDRVIPSSAACLSIARNSASRNRIVIGLPCPVAGPRDLLNLAQLRPRQPFAPARLEVCLRGLKRRRAAVG